MLDDLISISYVALIGAVWYGLARRQRKISAPSMPTLSLQDQADNIATMISVQRSWACIVYPEEDGMLRYLSRHNQELSHLDIVTMTSVALLGRLRDIHPNPDVADCAVDLLNALAFTTSSATTH